MKVPIAIWSFCMVLLTSYQLLAQTVSHYGDICDEDTQCVDHRMSCLLNDSEDSQKICLCTRFFIWNEEYQQCVQAMNMSAILKSLLEQRDVHRLNSITEHETFVKLGIVGLLSVVTLLIFIMCCIAYGCCSCTRVDNDDKLCSDSCPSHRSPLLKEDKWKDMTAPITPSFDDIDI